MTFRLLGIWKAVNQELFGVTGKLASAVRVEGQVLVFGGLSGHTSDAVSIRDTLFRSSCLKSRTYFASVTIRGLKGDYMYFSF
jgi:hypothetical protein